METDFKNISGMFRANTDIISKAIAEVRAEDWFRKPGDDSNHMLWLLGHVIVHRGHVLKTLGNQWDSSWARLFARGEQRLDDTEYPPVDEMRNAWNQISEQLQAALREVPEEILAQPAPEGPPSFDKKLSGTIAFFAFHDTYHTGQLSFLRKWLGYGQTVG
ncbi:MAG TPA: DinB family protein [Pyrinomonadaceae bacterium]|nr:DinB family protein [Pyrinomonadaceae bacterium]